MSSPVRLPSTSDYGDCTPAQTAQVLLAWCRIKAGHASVPLITLGVLAGIFIALGAVLFTTVMTGVPAWLGPIRLLGGFAFAMGLLLVCMTGAELSTGNCMLAAAWVQREMEARTIQRILAVSFLANAAGAVLVALLMAATGLFEGRHGRILVAMAETKAALPVGQAFARGILCNALVCLAVWLILSARTLPSKLVGLSLPIAAFVACGFEHSIANIYFFPAAALTGAQIPLAAALINITAVTVGNLVGGIAVALSLSVAHDPARQMSPNARASKEPGFVWQKAA